MNENQNVPGGQSATAQQPQQPSQPQGSPVTESTGIQGFPSELSQPQGQQQQPAPQPQPTQPSEVRQQQQGFPQQPVQSPQQPVQPQAQQSQPQSQPRRKMTQSEIDRVIQSWTGGKGNAPQPDLSQLPRQRGGGINEQAAQQYLVEYGNAIKKDIVSEIQETFIPQIRGEMGDAFQQQAQWSQLEQQYPQVKDPQVRQFVHQQQLGAMLTDPQNADLISVAQKIFGGEGLMTQATQQGYDSAKRNVRVQQTQHLQQNNAGQQPQAINHAEISERMTQGTKTEARKAAQDMMAQLYESGALGRKYGET